MSFLQESFSGWRIEKVGGWSVLDEVSTCVPSVFSHCRLSDANSVQPVKNMTQQPSKVYRPLQQTTSGQWRLSGRLLELFSAVLCTTTVYNDKHTHTHKQLIQLTVALGLVGPMTQRIPCNLIEMANQHLSNLLPSESASRPHWCIALVLGIPSRIWARRCFGW